MATLGDAIKQGKCWDALPVSDRNKIVGASSLENIAVVTPLKSWADLTELEREAMLAVDWTRATMSAPERCTVCLNPGKINHLGYCSDCVDTFSTPATQQDERDALQAAHEQRIPSPQELLLDPCTPFWASDVIRVALQKDAVDAANVFDLLAKSFDASLKISFKAAR